MAESLDTTMEHFDSLVAIERGIAEAISDTFAVEDTSSLRQSANQYLHEHHAELNSESKWEERDWIMAIARVESLQAALVLFGKMPVGLPTSVWCQSWPYLVLADNREIRYRIGIIHEVIYLLRSRFDTSGLEFLKPKSRKLRALNQMYSTCQLKVIMDYTLYFRERGDAGAIATMDSMETDWAPIKPDLSDYLKEER